MARSILARALRRLVDAACGARCVGCARRGAGTPCRDCVRRLDAMPSTAHAAWPDADVARRLVRSAKFGHWRAGGRLLAALAAARVPYVGIDLVTWVPGEPSRRARRGGHLPEALARAWARALGVPCRGMLQRRRGPTQQGLDRAQRHANVAHVWRLAPEIDPAMLAGTRILLVDDVRTTGATLQAAARVLASAGSTVATFALVEHGPASGSWGAGVARGTGMDVENPASCEEFVLTTVAFPADSVLHERRKDAPRVRKARPP